MAEQQAEHATTKALQERSPARRPSASERRPSGRALELKSQLYASIGIMAGSYAHNIKNLLVRPNDLLAPLPGGRRPRRASSTDARARSARRSAR